MSEKPIRRRVPKSDAKGSGHPKKTEYGKEVYTGNPRASKDLWNKSSERRSPVRRSSEQRNSVQRSVGIKSPGPANQGILQEKLIHIWRKIKHFAVKRKFFCISMASVILVFVVAIIVATASSSSKDSASLNVSATPGQEESSDNSSSGGFFKNMFGGKKNNSENSDSNTDGTEVSTEVVDDPVMLAYNANTKSGYMNNCVFLGDSRTVAMVSYGFISDDNAFAKVGIAHTSVANASITNNAGRTYTLDTYLASHALPVIFVCYGVNGMNGISEDKYESTYESLVDKIVSLAPNSNVVLMSIWPADDNGTYKKTVQNAWIEKYNKFLYDMAAKKGLHYLNVSEILKDDNGQMKKQYNGGDGLHYKAAAYNDILDYIIHHPVPGVSDAGDFVVHYVKPSSENQQYLADPIPAVNNGDILVPTVTPTPTTGTHTHNYVVDSYNADGHTLRCVAEGCPGPSRVTEGHNRDGANGSCTKCGYTPASGSAATPTVTSTATPVVTASPSPTPDPGTTTPTGENQQGGEGGQQGGGEGQGGEGGQQGSEGGQSEGGQQGSEGGGSEGGNTGGGDPSGGGGSDEGSTVGGGSDEGSTVGGE